LAFGLVTIVDSRTMSVKVLSAPLSCCAGEFFLVPVFHTFPLCPLLLG
jgi:hypothetical protein